MHRLVLDLRHALRRLTREPTFAAVSILTLALGIGATTAILSVVRSVLLEPLPYRNADRLVMVWSPGVDAGGTTWLSGQEILSYQRESTTLEQFAAYNATSVNLSGDMEPERVAAAAITGNTFEALGVSPLMGRTIQPADDVPGGGEVVVIGFGLWQRAFGGAPDIVGRSIRVSGVARTVVGVMPGDFRLPLDYREDRPSELWTPLGIDRANPGPWGDRSYIGFGVLKEGVSAGRATADLARIARGWIAQGFVADEGDRGLFRNAIPLHGFVTGGVRPALLVLLGAVGFVLLIACANVANLLLASADRRRRELALRSALGASRGRVIRQLLTEAMLLSLVGGIAGLAVAFGGTRALVGLNPAAIPRVENVGIDPTILWATALLVVLTGLIFGVIPALRLSRSDVAGMLKEGGRTTLGPGQHRFRQGLVVLEMAMSLLLLAGAGLLLRSFVELRRVDLGFDPSRVLTMRIVLPPNEYPDTTAVTGFYRRLIEGVNALPGVQSTAAVRVLPLTRTIGDWSITLEGRPRVPGENPNGDWQVVTPGYFQTMRIPLRRGRFFTETDMASGALSVVVSEALAAADWPHTDPVGPRFRLGTANQPWMTIVGIAGQVRHNALVEAPRTEMYLPHAQMPAEVGFAPTAMTLVARTTADPLLLVPAVRDLVRSIDAGLPLGEIRSMDSVVSDALSGSRFTALLLGVFAAVALLLAAIGIYGTISLLVAQRARELGIRMALGAGRGTILAMVLRRGMALAGIGAAAGLVAALLLTRVLESLVYGVGTLDVLTLATVPVALCLVALIACLAPALRAARLDPVVTLRDE